MVLFGSAPVTMLTWDSIGAVLMPEHDPVAQTVVVPSGLGA